MVSLIHPRLLSSLSATFYPSVCTIQVATETQDAYGQPIPAWADVPGLISLPCAVAPLNSGTPAEAERRRADGTIEVVTHHIAIAGYHLTIIAKMRAVVSGMNYDVVAVEFDSHAITTRLRTRLVS